MGVYLNGTCHDSLARGIDNLCTGSDLVNDLSIFYGDIDAKSAQEAFVKTFQKKEVPDEMPEYQLGDGQTVLDVILAAEMASSKSEARRLIDQKGVRLDGEVLERGDASSSLCVYSPLLKAQPQTSDPFSADNGCGQILIDPARNRGPQAGKNGS